MKNLMHAPYSKFKGWLRENGLTYSDLANLLGLNESTVSFKINGQSDFYLSEIRVIKQKYHLTSDIFFADAVA